MKDGLQHLCGVIIYVSFVGFLYTIITSALEVAYI